MQKRWNFFMIYPLILVIAFVLSYLSNASDVHALQSPIDIHNAFVHPSAKRLTFESHYYLYPYNLHLTRGETSSLPLTVIDDQGNPVSGDITFYGYDSTLIFISENGYVTALRDEQDSEIGTWVHASINGLPVANSTIVRVLSNQHDISFSNADGQKTVLYYPSNINGENISIYVTQYEMPLVNDDAYMVQSQMMGVQPFNGAKQIFEVDLAESENHSVCGISGNPIRLGWIISEDAWKNCFLVPFIPPRSPQWNVMYHEMGHNFTWASPIFRQGLSRFEYSEGVATALSIATIQTILGNPSTFPLNEQTRRSLEQQLNMISSAMMSNFQKWLDSGADFSQITPDIVDGIWLLYQSQRPSDFSERFFKPLQPHYADQVLPLFTGITQDDQHTVFAALVSAARGQNLMNKFINAYHYPINIALFSSTYSTFTQIMEDATPIPPSSTWQQISVRDDLKRSGIVGAYDDSRKKIVVFGGLSPTGALLSDTLEFDSNYWLTRHTPHVPPSRKWYGLAYDSRRHVTVMFGGQSEHGNLDDTWEYDGSDWKHINTEHRPMPRNGFAMVYDNCRDRVVLFGGVTDSGRSMETWEYDGSDWHLLHPIHVPYSRHLTSAAFDSRRCRTVLFGGAGDWTSGTLNGLKDTWEFDGSDWHQIPTSVSPQPRWAHAMTYDSNRHKVILFGGYGPSYPTGTTLNDAWEYDGNTWRKISVSNAPPPREQHGLVYDRLNRRLITFFGGWVYGDTWALSIVEPSDKHYDLMLPFVITR